ncbi:MAG: hypothetical protein NBV61_00835 [Algoriphagus sp.]|nr:hypothetical protein [Algoriphagus sp.]
MDRLKSFFLVHLFIIYTRYLIGGAFVFACIIKIKGKRFTTYSQEDAPLGSTMHFFEVLYQTGLYWQFIGWAQLLAGLLLMTQRFAKLGAVLNLPIILNVFVITISMEFGGTPLITGMMLLANLQLIVWHWGELRHLVNLPYLPAGSNQEENKPIWAITGLLLFGFTAGYRVLFDRYNPFLWFGVCFLIGLAAFLMRLVQRKGSKNNL